MSLSPQFVLLADKDLISEVGHGDAQAFATLYERHIRAAYALAYRLMGEKQASEDSSRKPSSSSGMGRQATGQSGAALGPGSSR
jgi:hypothetical protein